MKLLLFFLTVTPVFACKMTQEGGKRKAHAAAIDAVAKKLGHRNLKAFQKGESWYVRTTRLNCEDYKMEIDYGKGDCSTTAKIVSMRPCK